MNPQLIQIVDNALTVSLWSFLGLFLIFLLAARRRLARHAVRAGDSDRIEKLNPAFNQYLIVFRSAIVSLAFGLLMMAVLLFGPVPGLKNLVNTSSWQLTPLRVTALSWNRIYEGFTLEGEVWNQTQNDMEEVTVVISVVGSYDELLDSLEIPIEPRILPAGESGSFKVRYQENSPFIRGYRLGFRGKKGNPVAHTAGFDEPR